jgi:membrane-associated phospholipid phosphatase
MPFIALLLTASACGAFAWLVADRYPYRSPSTAEVARTIGKEVGHRGATRRLVARRLDPELATGLALTVALGLIAVCGVGLALLTYLVRSNSALAGIDKGVARWGDENAGPLSTDGLTLVTTLGETWLVAILAVALGVTETIRSRARWAIPFLVLAVLGNNVLTTTVKELTDRVRPDLNPLAATLGPSFPSGHSSTAACFYAAAAFLISRRLRPRMRPWVVAAATGIAVGVACSRVFLDVHWLSDVAAGLMLGWAWFAVCTVAFGGRLLRFGAAAEKVAEGAETLRMQADVEARVGGSGHPTASRNAARTTDEKR